MLSVKSACALTLAVVLAACSQSPAPDAASGKVVTEELPKPSVDQSTPDRALKSYFAIKDYLDARQYELDRDERGEALQRWADAGTRHIIRRAIDKSFVSGFRCVMAIGAALAVANAVTGVVWIQRERG